MIRKPLCVGGVECEQVLLVIRHIRRQEVSTEYQYTATLRAVLYIVH